jgi:hypothetical protein
MKLLQLYNEIKVNPPKHLNAKELDEDDYLIYYEIESSKFPFKLSGFSNIDDKNSVIVTFFFEDDNADEEINNYNYFKNILDKYNIKYRLEEDQDISVWIHIPSKYFNIK